MIPCSARSARSAFVSRSKTTYPDHERIDSRCYRYPVLRFPFMGAGAGWLDEISRERFDWARVGPHRIESELRPGLPCRIVAGEVGGLPVLYASIGVNGTLHYWQTASLDPDSRRPLSRSEALDHLWQVLDLVLIISRSEVRPEMVDWSREVA